MQIAVLKTMMDSMFKDMGIHWQEVEKKHIYNIRGVSDDTAKLYYFEMSQDGADVIIVEIDECDVLKLDAVQGTQNVFRDHVLIKEESLLRVSHDDALKYASEQVFAYFRESDYRTDYYDHVIECIGMEHQLKYSDLYLMVPGFFNDAIDSWKIEHYQDEYCKRVQSKLAEETEGDFAGKIERLYLDSITLNIDDGEEGKLFRQKARLYLIVHRPTNLCVLEIMVTDCYVGGNKVNCSFCGNWIEYEIDGKVFSFAEMLAYYNITPFGRKRSQIFSYGEAGKYEIANALASEESPMGRIKGEFLKLSNTDIALYDTAEVYISSSTMFEQVKERADCIHQRISYHSIEVFFVEMLLLQDAYVDKLYHDLCELKDSRKQTIRFNKTQSRLDRVNEELLNAYAFSDYDKFLYPATRMSSRNIANAFGLQSILDKYNKSVDIVKELIESNKRKIENRQDRIKNIILLLLTFLSAMGTLGEILYVSEDIKPKYAFWGAAALMIILLTLYYAVPALLKLVPALLNKLKDKFKNKS